MRLATTPRSGYRRWEMPQTYDTTFKELFAQNFVALLRWLIPDVKAYEVLKLPEELPLTTRRADLMVRIDGGLSGKSRRHASVVQIFDCQVQRDRRLPRSMLTRAVLAHDLYELPVKTTLLALTPKAVVQARYVFGTDEDGDPITSLAACHLAAQDQLSEAMQREAHAGRGGRHKLLLSLAQNGMPEKELRNLFSRDVDIADSEARRKAYYRARLWAIEAGYIEIAEGFVIVLRADK